VSVLKGRVWDVAVDLRPSSPSFKKHFGIELTGECKTQLFIPRGFAHGFVVLSEKADFFYKCDNFYEPSADAGIRFDDPELAIQWPLEAKRLRLSDKDKGLPGLKNAEFI
jgi:dTDP-4-dehydrorhamnose 3,5-epimerase